MQGRKDKPMYFQFEPAAFLGDSDFQAMTATERGIYFTLILYLYTNGGKLDTNRVAIGTLCHMEEGDETWAQSWAKIAKKFSQKKNVLQHKRVSREIVAAKRRMQKAVAAGLRGARKRWGGYSDPNGDPIAKVSKEKVSKEKEDNTPPTPPVADEETYLRPHDIPAPPLGDPELLEVLEAWAKKLNKSSTLTISGKDHSAWAAAVAMHGKDWCLGAVQRAGSIHAGVVIVDAEKRKSAPSKQPCVTCAACGRTGQWIKKVAEVFLCDTCTIDDYYNKQGAKP